MAGAGEATVLNLVAAKAEGNRRVSAELAREGPGTILPEIARMRTLSLARRHEARLADLHPERLERVLLAAYEAQPEDYTALLAVPGVGAMGLRALVAELTTASRPRCEIRSPTPGRTAARTARPVSWTGPPTTRPSSRCGGSCPSPGRGRTEKSGALRHLARVSHIEA